MRLPQEIETTWGELQPWDRVDSKTVVNMTWSSEYPAAVRVTLETWLPPTPGVGFGMVDARGVRHDEYHNTDERVTVMR